MAQRAATTLLMVATPTTYLQKNETGNAHHTATRESDYEYNMRSKQEEARMDEILDKIHRSGYDSLTPDEKKELFRISRR